MAFHVNPKNGDVGACRASKSCPFGGVDEHYESPELARSSYEKSQKTFGEVEWSLISTEELQANEVAMLRDYREQRRELTSEEYCRHYEYIRRVRKSNPSTHKEHTSTVKGKVTYSDARLKLHEELVSNLTEAYSTIPSAGKLLIIGGITGAGKTTELRSNPELQAEIYAPVNADEVKVAMVKLGMTPEIPGLLPLETDELIKYEAQVITEKLYSALSANRKNLALDRTMASSNQLTKTLQDLQTKGYTDFTGVFVDVEPDEAYERIRNRHAEGLNRYLITGEGYGERPVPGAAIAATRTDDGPYRSKNAKVFVELADAGFFSSEPLIFDSSAGGRRVSLSDFRN